jgi:hypothetical protein
VNFICWVFAAAFVIGAIAGIIVGIRTPVDADSNDPFFWDV